MPDPDPWRRVSRDSEDALLRAFEAQGAHAIICCNFKTTVRSSTELIQFFSQADICVGMHGAGLANCVLGPEKQVLVELQTHHAFGFDSYMKIVHMSKGSYIFYDSRDTPKLRASGAGAVIPEGDIKQLVEMSMKEYRKLRRGGIASEGHSGHNNFAKQRVLDVEEASKSSRTAPLPSTRATNRVELKTTMTAQKKSFVVTAKTFASRSPRKNVPQRRRLLIVPRNTSAKTKVSSPASINVHDPNKQKLNKKFITFPASVSSKRFQPPPNASQSSVAAQSSALDAALANDLLVGPLLSNNEAHCKQLPYYKLRLLTMPQKEHKFECDRNKIYRKATFAVDHKLLKDFIYQDGRAMYF